ncbi:Gfo/Idh/MocA family protein [Jatrophihabitans sp. YIM 134969]
MTATPDPLTWAVLGTANIARAQFLPALAEAGGRPLVVAGRDGERARAFADAVGVERGVEGYEAALEDPAVEAVYVALPNAAHAEWTMRALEAGKAVLCEKPLCTSPGDVGWVLGAAEATGGLLWESFVFPFGPQFLRVVELLAEGVVGEVQEIQSSFHFALRRADDIRLSAGLGGGSIADVGCYPVRLAQLLFGAAPERVAVNASHRGEVDVSAAGVLDHPGGGRLVFSCGFERPYDTTTRILGSEGRIEIDNPYHPGADDRLTLVRPGHEPVQERAMTDQRSFTAAIRHVTAAVRGIEAPRHLAADDSLATARTLATLQDHA